MLDLLKKLNRQLKVEMTHCKITMIVDNYLAHPTIELDNIQVVFLYPYTMCLTTIRCWNNLDSKDPVQVHTCEPRTGCKGRLCYSVHLVYLGFNSAPENSMEKCVGNYDCKLL